VDLTSLECTFVLALVLEVHHSLTVASIIFPFSNVHVSVGIFPEATSLKPTINEVPLVTDTAIFDKHAKSMVSTILPLALIVLTLILPDIDTVSAEIILMKFTFITMFTFLKEKHQSHASS
jgi:1-acyl-sn-glycerol-3-phosphate acyltransferase